jgi:hypothetical protein
MPLPWARPNGFVVGRRQASLRRYDGRLIRQVRPPWSGSGDCGLDVWRAGLGPTPLLYYATLTQGAAGGIMITGSHNPPDHNGFKMMLGKAAFYGDAIQELGRWPRPPLRAARRGEDRRVFDSTSSGWPGPDRWGPRRGR